MAVESKISENVTFSAQRVTTVVSVEFRRTILMTGLSQIMVFNREIVRESVLLTVRVVSIADLIELSLLVVEQAASVKTSASNVKRGRLDIVIAAIMTISEILGRHQSKGMLWPQTRCDHGQKHRDNEVGVRRQVFSMQRAGKQSVCPPACRLCQGRRHRLCRPNGRCGRDSEPRCSRPPYPPRQSHRAQ